MPSTLLSRLPTVLVAAALLLPAAPALGRGVEVERQRGKGPDLVTGRARIGVPPDRLVPLLETPCHVHNWLPKVDRIRMLEPDGGPGRLVYVAKDGGWLAKGRDAVLRYVREGRDPVQVSVTAEPDHIPTRDDYIRIPYSEVRWSLSEEQGTTLVDYRQRLSVGGKVPQWLADRASTGYVRDSLEALIEYAETPDSGDCAAGDR